MVMTVLWPNTLKALEERQAVRWQPFNVYANFQPGSRTSPRVNSSNSSGDTAVSGPDTPVDAPWAELIQGSDVYPMRKVAGRCNCGSRSLEVSNIPAGNEHFIINIIRQYGGGVTETTHSPPFSSISARFSDDRMAAQVKNYLTQWSVNLHNGVRVNYIMNGFEECMLISLPWGISCSDNGIRRTLEKHGDISHFRYDKNQERSLYQAIVTYHNVCDLVNAANSPVIVQGIKLFPQMVSYPHSYICDQANAHSPSDLNSPSRMMGARFHAPHEKIPGYRNLQSTFTEQEKPNGRPLVDRTSMSPFSFPGEHNTASLPKVSPLDTSRVGPDARFLAHTKDQASSQNFTRENKDQCVSTKRSSNSPNSSLLSNNLKRSASPSAQSIASDTVSNPRTNGQGDSASLKSFNSVSSASTAVSIKGLSETEVCLEHLKRFSINRSDDSKTYRQHERSSRSSSISLGIPKAPSGEGSQRQGAESSSNSASRDSTTIDLKAIEDGHEKRTTVMVRNIPNKLEFDDFKRFVDQTNKNTYEFLYLRFDFCNRCNVGYAFISFATPEDVKTFVEKRTGMKWNEHNYNSEKVIDIRFARIQGCHNLIQKFQNSPVMSQELAFRPRLYYADGERAGQEKPFPTSKSKA